MRFLILIALCLAVASANYANKQRFNRLLRQLQQQQNQEQGYGYGQLGHQYEQYNEYDSDEEDQEEDEEEKYQRRHQQGQQCQRNQRYGNLNLNDDDDSENEYDSSEQDDENQYQNQYQHQYQNQRRQHQRRQYQEEEDEQEQQQQGNRQHQQQQKKKQQQKHQCQAKYQLLQDLEQVNSQLAAKLYKQAKQENDDKNTVVGPAAVQLALAAIKRGARGNTKRQIQRLIGAGLSQKQSQQAHAALQQSLQGQDPLQKQSGQHQQAKVKTTTTIIINQRNRAQQKFVQAVKACLNAQVKKCDFHRQPQQCRQQINQHVAQKTNQKLQNVVPQDAVTENTKLIVVNTAQLKAKWGKQFRNQQQTKQGRFYPLGSKQAKNVQVLQTQGQFNYYEDNQVQVVGVPTQREELTLYVVVPKDKDGLNQIEKTQIQNGQQLKQLLDQADQQQEQIELQLPKFQIKHKIDAKRTLRQEGAKDAFDADEADLSGINGQQQQQQQHNNRNQQDEDEQEQQEQQQGQHQLHINKLIHQATIKIDEQGISAAKPKHQGQQQYGRYHEQQQYEQEDYEDDEQNDENDEQQDQYEQRQLLRQELEEEIFGQRQQGGRRHQRQQHHQRQHQYQGQEKQVKVNRAFAFVVKHNPSNQIVLVGRVVDAAQKPKNKQQGQRQGQQSLNGVDQE
jgi:serpin B